MGRLFFFVVSCLCWGALYGNEDYTEPQDVATTEGLPSSLVNQAVCAISGEYTDSVVDMVLPGPEPLVISRVYTSFASKRPWAFNYLDQLVVGEVMYDQAPSYIISLQQPSGGHLDYIFKKVKGHLKLKKLLFSLVCPKGLTNGASLLSGKIHIKNQTVHFYPNEDRIMTESGNGTRKVFKRMGMTEKDQPMFCQILEEKVNGSQLRSIIRYSGTSTKAYVPYTKECFIWNKDGCLTAKIFKDGSGHVHHARTFSYDDRGNVLTSQLCEQLTGHPSPALLVDEQGRLIENGYERETKTYTYSNDGFNLLLTETDAAGKTVRYTYQTKSDLLNTKFLSYEGQVRLREFYSYDQNHTLERKILDDGVSETGEDFSGVTERHYTLISPRTEAPLGLPQQ